MAQRDAMSTAGCGAEPGDRIVSFEAEIVRKHLAPRVAKARAEGLPIALSGEGDPDDIRLQFHASDWMHVRLERDAHLSEGKNRRSSARFRIDEPRVGARFTAFVNEIAALIRRDREIKAAGDDPACPGPEFVEMHPLVAHVLRSVGVSTDQVMHYDRRSGDLGRNDYGVLMRQVSLEGRRGGVFMSHHLRNRIVQCSVTAIHGGGGTRDHISLSHEPGRLIVAIPSDELPQAAMTSLPGRTLSDVVSHPLLDGAAPARIVSAVAWSNGKLALTIEQKLVTVAEAWRRH